jgi:hypothetical protein
MGTANKDRQAAFKIRMRASGKRQLTVWADRYQEQAVRDLLAGEPLRYQEQDADDARAERARLLAAREHSLDQRELQLQNRERELERQLPPADADAPGAAGMEHAVRVNALVKAFTTDRNPVTGEPKQISTPFMAKVQSDLITDLARKTTTVRNGLAALPQ